MVAIAGLITVTIVVALALWKGDRPTRLAAVATAAAWLVGLVAHLVPDQVLPVVLLASDGVLASALLLIAVRYSSLWTALGMLIQALAFGVHAWALQVENGAPPIYLLAVTMLSLGLLASLLSATVAYRRKQRRRPGALFAAVAASH